MVEIHVHKLSNWHNISAFYSLFVHTKDTSNMAAWFYARSV